MRQVSETWQDAGRHALAWLLAATLLSGCESLLPRRVGLQPEPELPLAYHHQARSPITRSDTVGEPYPAQGGDTKPDTTRGPLPGANDPWWAAFRSEELNGLIAQAMKANPDIRISALRIDQARIRAEQAQGASLPTVNLPFRMVATNAGGVTDAQQSSQISMAAAWRADVWGEQRGLIESAQLQIARTHHEQENTRRIVAASVVSAYIAWLAASDSLSVVQAQASLSQQLMRTVEQRLALREATAEELEQQRAQLHALQASLPAIERQRDNQAIALARLLGTVPGRLPLRGGGLETLQLPAFASGIPSTLLLRRPDIRMVEARMRAANADIEVARARMLPPVDLAAQIGFSGVTLSSMLQPQAFLANTLASIAATIFDGGRRAGNQAIAESVYLEMTETYQMTVLQAVREVESALSSLHTLQRQFGSQQAAARAHLNRLKLTHQAYAAGSVDLAALIEARRNWERVQDDLVRLRAELLTAHASLAFVLGDEPVEAITPKLSQASEARSLEPRTPLTPWRPRAAH